MAIVLDGTTGITTPAIDAGNDVGQVATFAMSTAPTGWLKANGATVSRTTYAALFTAIGTTYGAGDGSTTFLLPDMRGEFARGWDDGRGVDSGRAFGSAQTDAFQGHWHDFYVGNTDASFNHLNSSNQIALANNAGGRSLQSTAAGLQDQINSPKSDTVNGTPRTATETRPRNVALLACIKF
jgi:microcystin-dependent protein